MKTIRRKSLLYESKVPYADYALNHILGCAHGCKYPCYAFLEKKRFGEIKNYDDWREPRLVENPTILLEKDLKRIGPENIRDVHLCFTSDPFMYDYDSGKNFSEIENTTLLILFQLWNEGVHTTTLTKGIYPTDTLFRMPGNKLNNYGITLVSINEEFQKRFEPHAAPWFLRLQALEKLNNAGLYTWISMEPFPTPYLDHSFWGTIDNLMDAIQFVDKIIFGPWNYNSTVKEYDRRNGGDFYSKTVEKMKTYCNERGIEFYNKMDAERSDTK